jgi:site-specific DNA-methyltransferase (adenine-specific)
VTYQLHHGDCVEWLRGLPDKSADHTITDPPYEAEAHTKQRRTLGGVSGRGAARGVTRVIQSAPLDFAAITPAEREAASREIVRVTRGWAIVFCQVEGAMRWQECLVSAGAKARRIGVWIKPNGQPQISGDRPGMGYESIVFVWCGRGGSRWHGGGRVGVFTHTIDTGAFAHRRAAHPTEKPLPLMSELVSLFTDPGDLVLDPYAGSGTTGVACMRLGRRFAGAERDDRYHALAKERLDAEASGISLQASRAGQQSLFGGDK